MSSECPSSLYKNRHTMLQSSKGYSNKVMSSECPSSLYKCIIVKIASLIVQGACIFDSAIGVVWCRKATSLGLERTSAGGGLRPLSPRTLMTCAAMSEIDRAQSCLYTVVNGTDAWICR